MRQSLDRTSLFLLDLSKVIAAVLVGFTVVYFGVIYMFSHTF